jgi:hypothetical protein
MERLAKIEKGQCGGFYKMGERNPLQLVCIDADNDSKNQMAEISDCGVLRKNESLIISAEAFLGVEKEGAWTLQKVKISPL